MLKHNFRDVDTPNADESRTGENEHLTAKSVEDGMRRYRERLPDKVRNNAVHAIDYLVTTSPSAAPEANEQALQVAFEWLCDKHGRENVIMASKHRDESTAHAHFLVVPLDEKGKLNARAFIGGTKHRMSKLQDEFINEIKSRGIDLERGLKGSKARHTRIKDFYKALGVTRPSKAPQIALQDVSPQKLGVIKKETTKQVVERLNDLVRLAFNAQEKELTSLRVAHANEKARNEQVSRTYHRVAKLDAVLSSLSREQVRAVANYALTLAKQTMAKTQSKSKDIER